MIQTVKQLDNGYLVNGVMSVPNDPANSDYATVALWLEGKTDDWLELEAQHNASIAAHDNWLAIQSYESDWQTYLELQAEYDAWTPESGNLSPESPVAPIMPEGYWTQEEVDLSIVEHDAWTLERDTFESVEGSVFIKPEPIIKLRPVDLTEPVIIELPAPVPNTPEPQFTQAELDALAYQQAKQDKIDAVDQIIVTTNSGKQFNGDEVAQNRMARAVAASSVGDVTQWRLADNSVAVVTHEELKEALLLAGEAMTVIWMQ